MPNTDWKSIVGSVAPTIPNYFAGLSGDFDGQGMSFGVVHGIIYDLEAQFGIRLAEVNG